MPVSGRTLERMHCERSCIRIAHRAQFNAIHFAPLALHMHMHWQIFATILEFVRLPSPNPESPQRARMNASMELRAGLVFTTAVFTTDDSHPRIPKVMYIRFGITSVRDDCPAHAHRGSRTGGEGAIPPSDSRGSQQMRLTQSPSPHLSALQTINPEY